MADLTPYSTVRPLLGPLESWLTGDDALRLAAYQTYESIYRNVPSAFKLIQRGDEANPIYIPSAKTIIEAKNRYLAKRWDYVMDPKLGTDGDRAEMSALLTQLFRREQLYSKFATQKRFGLIRGDSVWHIRGDLDKDPGTRISVDEVDPGSYFPILDDWNPERRLGVHLVDPVETSDGKTVIKRQTYRKQDNGRVTYEQTWWETGAWDDRDDSVTLKRAPTPTGQEAVSEYELDARITSIPVYHVKNNRSPGEPFGASELQGFELLIAAINQSISDEDLTLVMQGLGLYWTNSGPPTDDEGNEINWRFGPGWVLEVDEDSTFGRVNGVSTVAPMLEHIGKLESSMREAAGVPNIAIGNVDTNVAESGIALAFHMAPILSANEEKEQEILSVTDNLLFDLCSMWFPVFEGMTSEARALSVVDDPLPINRKAVLDEIIAMLVNKIITIEYAQQLISEKLGYEFPADMLAGIVAEQEQLANAADPFAARAARELGGDGA